MTEQDDQLLSRFIDGELDREETRALRERLLADRALRAELERMRAVDDGVKAAFDFPGAERVPAAVAARVRGKGAASRPLHRWGMAIAASLVAAAGLLLAPQWREATERPDGRPASDALLAQVLETRASRGEGWDTLQDGRRIRPVLSFSSNDGNWCREYLLLQQRDSFRGVACRGIDGQWRTEVLAAIEWSGSGDDYRPASASGSAGEVASYIDTHAAGIPLSLQQEAELIAREWQ